MIISPSPRPTVNVLHAINNAYKCVDLVYMLSKSKEDCNLWLQRLYWARDPDDPFEAPNFVGHEKSVYLLRDDLVGIDKDSDKSMTETYGIPYRFYSQLGDSFEGTLYNPCYARWLRVKNPVLVYPSYDNLDSQEEVERGTEAFWKWALTRAYFPPQALQLTKAYSPPQYLGTNINDPNYYMTLPYCVRAEDLTKFHIQDVTALRVMFGGKKTIRSVLFYRPYEGFMLDEHYAPEQKIEPNDIQLLLPPDDSDSFSQIANLSELPDFREYDDPREESDKFPYKLFSERHIGSTHGVRYSGGGTTMYRYETPRTYYGGLPTVVNLDEAVTANELHFRWSGQLSHINFLDVPVVRAEGWTLPDHPGMTYSWPHQRNIVLAQHPELENSDLPLDEKRFEYIGDLDTGIRFLSPRVLNSVTKWPDSYYAYDIGGYLDSLAKDPYQCIDLKETTCLWYGDRDEKAGDIWQFRNFARPPEAIANKYVDLISADGRWYAKPWFNDSTSFWKEESYVLSSRQMYSFHDIRDVGDNRAYVANKRLVGWYYNADINAWRSNRDLPSTPNQFRILVTFAQPVVIRGCLNPMSVPATWNKPTFYADGEEFYIDPRLYGDYLVPWVVRIEGKADNLDVTPWELMDEYTLEHFSAEAHARFSYPARVRQIRITVQEWYGRSFVDDLDKDWFYPTPEHNLTGEGQYESSLFTDAYLDRVPADQWLRDGGIHAPYVVRKDYDLTIGAILSGRSRVKQVEYSRSYAAAHAERKSWAARDVRTLWSGIYIPPFIFFGGDDDGIVNTTVESDAGPVFTDRFRPVQSISGVPESMPMRTVSFTPSVEPVTATNTSVNWSVPSGNAAVRVNRSQDGPDEVTVMPTNEDFVWSSGFPRYGTTADLRIVADKYFAPIVLRAVVKDGLGPGRDFSRDFELRVTVPLDIAAPTITATNYTLNWTALRYISGSASNGTYVYTNNTVFYSGFEVECCRNPTFTYYEESCPYYPDCPLQSDCVAFAECDPNNNRKQRLEPLRSLSNYTMTSSYAKKDVMMFLRVRALSIFPELNSEWSDTFTVETR